MEWIEAFCSSCIANAVLSQVQVPLIWLRRLVDVVEKAVVAAQTRASNEAWVMPFILHVPDHDNIGSLPIVNGFMLGYPFVYNVSSSNAVVAAKALSSGDLLVFECGTVMPNAQH